MHTWIICMSWSCHSKNNHNNKIYCLSCRLKYATILCHQPFSLAISDHCNSPIIDHYQPWIANYCPFITANSHYQPLGIINNRQLHFSKENNCLTKTTFTSMVNHDLTIFNSSFTTIAYHWLSIINDNNCLAITKTTGYPLSNRRGTIIKPQVNHRLATNCYGWIVSRFD